MEEIKQIIFYSYLAGFFSWVIPAFVTLLFMAVFNNAEEKAREEIRLMFKKETK